MARDCGFPPIREAWTLNSAKEESSLHLPRLCTNDEDLCLQLLDTSTLQIVILPKNGINIFNHAIKDHIRMDMHRGKELNYTDSLGSVFTCLLTAWLFYLNLL